MFTSRKFDSDVATWFIIKHGTCGLTLTAWQLYLAAMSSLSLLATTEILAPEGNFTQVWTMNLSHRLCKLENLCVITLCEGNNMTHTGKHSTKMPQINSNPHYKSYSVWFNADPSRYCFEARTVNLHINTLSFSIALSCRDTLIRFMGLQSQKYRSKLLSVCNLTTFPTNLSSLQNNLSCQSTPIYVVPRITVSMCVFLHVFIIRLKKG